MQIIYNSFCSCQRADRRQLKLPPLSTTIRSSYYHLTVMHFIHSIAFILIFFAHLFQAQNSIYETLIACEYHEMNIACLPNHEINVIRSNFGRFTVDACNEEGNQTLPTNCMSHTAHRVMHSLCANKQNCTVMASKEVFKSNTCPGVPKYLEVQYQCVHKHPSRTGFKRLHYQLQNQVTSTSSSTVSTPFLLNRNKNFNPNPKLDNVNTMNSQYLESFYTPSNSSTNSDELNKNKKVASLYHLDNNQNPFLINHKNSYSDLNFAQNKVASPENDLKKIPTPPTNNKTNYCPPVSIRRAFFDWTLVDYLAYVPCPAGSQNNVSWFCKFDANLGQAAWFPPDKPDFSKCSSLWVSSIEERLREGKSSVFSLANELALVTSNTLDNDLNLPDSSVDNTGLLGTNFNLKPNHSNKLNAKQQQQFYAIDLYRISEIISIIVNKMAAVIENNNEMISFGKPKPAYANHVQRQSESVQELLVKIQNSLSNILAESNYDSWLELQPGERAQAFSMLISSLQKNAFLFAAVRIMPSNFVRIQSNIFLEIYIKHMNTENFLKLPIKQTIGTLDSANSNNQLEDEENYSELDEILDQKNGCSVYIPKEILAQYSVNGLVKLVFIIFGQLNNLLPYQEVSDLKHPINYFNKQPSTKTSLIISDVVSLLSQKQSLSLFNLRSLDYENVNDKNHEYNKSNEKMFSNRNIIFTFKHRFQNGLEFWNLMNIRCVLLNDTQTISQFNLNSNNYMNLNRPSILNSDFDLNHILSSSVSSDPLSRLVTPNEFTFFTQPNVCRTLNVNSTHTTCSCSELGSYVVLADLTNSTQPNSNSNNFNVFSSLTSPFMTKLNRICLISCAICSIIILSTICYFKYILSKDNCNNFNIRTSSNPSYLLNNHQTQENKHFKQQTTLALANDAKLNYLMCLLALQVAVFSSLILSELNQFDEHFAICRFSSIAIHYFVLTIFAWLLFDCFTSSYLLVFSEQHQFQAPFLNVADHQTQRQNVQQLVMLQNNDHLTTTTATTSNISQNQKFTLRTCKLLAYVLPLLIVVLSFCINPSGYCSNVWHNQSDLLQSLSTNNEQKNKYYAICWHVLDNIYIMSLIVPLIALLLASLVFVCVALALNYRNQKLIQKTNKQLEYLNEPQKNMQNICIKSKNSKFTSNTRFNVFNLIISTVCWSSAILYMNNLLDTFEKIHFQHIASDTFIHKSYFFTKLINSNLALFAILFSTSNILHTIVIFIRFCFKDCFLIHKFCKLIWCSFTSFQCCDISNSKEHINANNNLPIVNNYTCYTPSSIINHSSNQNTTLKFDLKQARTYDCHTSSTCLEQQNQQQQMPLIPPPQLISQKYYNSKEINHQAKSQQNITDTYENENVASQTINQEETNNIQARNVETDSFLVSSLNSKNIYLKRNNAYGQVKLNRLNQMEHYYECIGEDNVQMYEPIIYSPAYADQSDLNDYHIAYNLHSNKNTKPNQLIHLTLNSKSGSNSSKIENKLIRNYSSNDFHQLDQSKPLLSSVLNENSSKKNHPFIKHTFNRQVLNNHDPNSRTTKQFYSSSSADRSLLNATSSISPNNMQKNQFAFYPSSLNQEVLDQQQKNLHQVQQKLQKMQQQLANSQKEINKFKFSQD